VGKTRQVIIGNSAAGLSAIKGIRKVDRVCPIILISVESCNAYSPVLTTYYLKGRISKEDFFIVDSDFYRSQGIKTVFGRKVIEVDPLEQKVRLDNGIDIMYDNLLIATGASPINLGSSGNGLDNVFSLRTIESAEGIFECAKTAKEVVLIGAGLISLQTGDALSKEGVKLTIIEQARQILPETVDDDCAAIVQKELESCGISILLGEKVKGIRRRGNKAIVTSHRGKELAADMVVVGIGVRPNIELVKNSGIKIDRGIWVDDTMRTNINNIFAAGDVSQGENLVTGRKEVLPNWINACRQGRIAGLNMAGSQWKYEGGLRETVTTIFGLTIVAIGLSRALNDGQRELLCCDSVGKVYRKIVLANNKIVGCVLMGSVKDAGILKHLISNRGDLLSWKERIVAFPLDLRQLLPSIAGC